MKRYFSRSKLRRAREARGLSQGDLGRLLGVRSSRPGVIVQQYENGRRLPSVSRLWELAAKLDVTPDELMGSRPPKKIPRRA